MGVKMKIRILVHQIISLAVYKEVLIIPKSISNHK